MTREPPEPPEPDVSRASVAPGRLLAQLVGVAQALGRVPTEADVERHGAYPTAWYRAEFGSWDGALRASGLVDEGPAERAGV